MIYGLIYTVPFATLDNIPCVVEVEKEGYIGASTELTAGDTPFSVDITDDEFLYIPTRFSTAKLQVVGKDYLQSIFSTEYRQYRVTFKKDGIITWCGFIKPELYTQDYSSETFVLEIECISAMSVLEFIDYTTERESKEFVSLWRLLQRCIEASYGQYNAVYLPFVYAKTKEDYIAGANVIEAMTISEQDFFDEDDKPMKLREVLEEVCKFLNWTCVDWKGELYFVDVDHMGMYHRYNIGLTDKQNESINELNIQTISYAGNDHLLDILPGYNKVIVKCSNYPVGRLFQDEDFSMLKQFSYEKQTNGDAVSEKYFYYPKTYTLYQYKYTTSVDPMSAEQLEEHKNAPNNILGALNIRRCSYKMVNGQPDIHNYNWEELIQVRRGFKTANGSHEFLSTVPVIEYKELLPTTAYSDGAICISCSVQITENSDLTTDNTIRKGYVRARCMLSIGDFSYTGSEWVYADADQWFELKFPMQDVGGGGFGMNENTKTLMQPYDDLTGYVIELPKGKPLVGNVMFKMCSMQPQPGSYTSLFAGVGYFIKDLKVAYAVRNDMEEDNSNSDRTYENILNESYINEMDEIELKISSYNKDGACYGKVIIKEGYSHDYLTDNLYNAILDKTKRPEELLITRIINHYSAPRIKLTQVIKNSDDISPLTILSDTFLVNKKFINAGGSIDYKMNRFECVMIEK